MRLLGEFESLHPMRTPVGEASCLRHMILKLINSELLHAAGTIVKLPTKYNFYYLHSKKAQDSLLSKAILWFLKKCISSLFPSFMLTLWALLSFDTVAFGKNIFLGHLKAFLILKYILLRCSTFSSAEAPDFVYNLRRCSLIRINLGFTVFILVRFGLYKK